MIFKDFSAFRMNQPAIPDFEETELDVVRTVLSERYGKKIELELADTELKLDPKADTLTWCPAVFWAERGASFVVLKTGKQK